MATYIEDIRRGDDYKVKFNFGDNNITDFEIWLTIKNAFTDTDADAVLQYKIIAGSDSADTPLTGICYMHIPAALTKPLPIGSFFYDLQVRTPDGQIATIAPPNEEYKDKIKIIPEITQAII